MENRNFWVVKWYKTRARFLVAVVYIEEAFKNAETTDKDIYL